MELMGDADQPSTFKCMLTVYVHKIYTVEY